MDAYTDSRGAEMEPMEWAEALEIVHSLADQNVLTPDQVRDDPSLEAHAEWQRSAVDTFGDFITNHYEAVDDLEPSPAAEDWPDGVWMAVAGSDANDLVEAIRISLQIAGQNAIDPADAARDVLLADEVDRQQQAFDMTKDFLGMHGAKLKSEVKSINVSPLFQ